MAATVTGADQGRAVGSPGRAAGPVAGKAVCSRTSRRRGKDAVLPSCRRRTRANSRPTFDAGGGRFPASRSVLRQKGMSWPTASFKASRGVSGGTFRLGAL